MLNKNNQIIAILSFCLCILSLTSCEQDRFVANGPIVTEALILNSFDGIDLDCSADIFVSQGPVQSVSVRGNSNIIANLKREVVNGVWKVDLLPGNYNFRELTITITVPDLNLLKIDGSGDIQCETFEVNKMDIQIDGSGNVDFVNGLSASNHVLMDIDGSGDISMRDLNTPSTTCKIDGSGDVKLQGKSSEASYTIDGSGDISAFELDSENVSVDIDASGDVRVSVAENLSVTIDGNGDVYYKGQPSVNSRVDGAGRVINAN
jgi:hypothetical protein